MARLIDADALWYRTFSCEDAADVRKEIKIAPTVDAVEVVRCKECENHEPFTFFGIEAHWCKRNEKLVVEDDFCSYGYRRMSI